MTVSPERMQIHRSAQNIRTPPSAASTPDTSPLITSDPLNRSINPMDIPAALLATSAAIMAASLGVIVNMPAKLLPAHLSYQFGVQRINRMGNDMCQRHLLSRHKLLNNTGFLLFCHRFIIPSLSDACHRRHFGKYRPDHLPYTFSD